MKDGKDIKLLLSDKVLSSKVRPSPLFKKRERNEERYTRDRAIVKRVGCDVEGMGDFDV